MVWRNTLRSFKILYDPVPLFEELRQQPRWIVLFLIISIVTMTVGYLVLPFKHEIALTTLTHQFGEMRARETLSAANHFGYIGILFSPVPLVIKWLVIGTLFYYAAILMESHQIEFKKIFSVIVHAELIFVLMGLTNLLVLELLGTEAVKNMTETQTIVGLEYFLPEGTNNIYLQTILGSFNVFTVWYIIVIAIGLSIVGGLQRWKSSIIVLSVWSLGIVFQVGIAFLKSAVQTMLGQ